MEGGSGGRGQGREGGRRRGGKEIEGGKEKELKKISLNDKIQDNQISSEINLKRKFVHKQFIAKMMTAQGRNKKARHRTEE